MEILTVSSIQTKKVGMILAREILDFSFLRNQAFTIVLKGCLGSGKTTFLKGFARGLGIRKKILSPTFVIVKKFKIPHSIYKTFYHIDCYRILKTKEIIELGFKEIINNPHNIIAIEWGERIKQILPRNSLVLEFKFINENKRIITIR